MALRWDQIIKHVDAGRLARADSTVSLINLKLGHTKKTGKPVAAAKVFSIDQYGKERRKNKYVTSITWLNADHVFLSCSCDDFKYTWEYALTRKGAAEIKFSNGEPPDERNPRYKTAACKHLVYLYTMMGHMGNLKNVSKYFAKYPQFKKTPRK